MWFSSRGGGLAELEEGDQPSMSVLVEEVPQLEEVVEVVSRSWVVLRVVVG